MELLEREQYLSDLNAALADLTNDLQSEGAFELALAPDSTVLVRDLQAYIFILIEYSAA